MEPVRFFVAGLPGDTTEEQLRALFDDYGQVLLVDLKTKKNLVDENVKIIAFVTLKVNDSNDVDYCLNELNWCNWRGAQINVSQAKESFLERLKREREDAEAAATQTQPAVALDENDENASKLLLRNNAPNKRRTFAEDEKFDDVDIALMITKKRAASSMHNGRIVIQSFDAPPIHVVEMAKQTKKARLDDKSQAADQKRKESLNKMKNAHTQKKSAIQAALAYNLGADSKSTNKIRFNDAEDDDDEVANVDSKNKTNIFGSDDEEDTAKYALKPEHFDSKGEKLARLQSQQLSVDPRFRIDANFVDDEDVENNSAVRHDTDNGEMNERDWQMDILQQVVGTQLDTRQPAERAAQSKRMLHYDPSKASHEKFVRDVTVKTTATTNDTSTAQTKGKRHKKEQGREEIAQETDGAPAAAEVSKEVFYVVTDTLTQSLKTRGDGFSLLQMFGQQAAQQEERVDKLKQVTNEKILVSNKKDASALQLPFSYDSSTDEENGDESQQPLASGQTAKQKKIQVKVETFFIPKNDARLKDGAKFFQFNRQKALATAENYEDVRNHLKLLIKTKITKTKKHLAAAGVKSKKRRAR